MKERTQSHSHLEQRLAAVEARLRRAHWTWLALCAALLASAQVGADVPKQQRARQLEIVNERGEAVLIAGSDTQGNGLLRIASSAGRLVDIGSDGFNNGAIELFNKDGARIGFLGANAKGDGGMRVSSRDGDRHFYIGDDVRGNGLIELAEPPGRRLLR